MTDNVLRIVKSGEPGPNPQMVEVAEATLADVKAGKYTGLLVIALCADGEPEITVCGDDGLVLACTAEELGWQMKRQLIGL
jgi:hypothetical protein